MVNFTCNSGKEHDWYLHKRQGRFGEFVHNEQITEEQADILAKQKQAEGVVFCAACHRLVNGEVAEEKVPLNLPSLQNKLKSR